MSHLLAPTMYVSCVCMFVKPAYPAKNFLGPFATPRPNRGSSENLENGFQCRAPRLSVTVTSIRHENFNIIANRTHSSLTRRHTHSNAKTCTRGATHTRKICAAEVQSRPQKERAEKSSPFASTASRRALRHMRRPSTDKPTHAIESGAESGCGRGRSEREDRQLEALADRVESDRSGRRRW